MAIWGNKNLVNRLKNGGVVIMPTDTLYGIVGSAENPQTVDRIYKLRKRSPGKPFIILIGNLRDMEKFSINLSLGQRKKIKDFWPFGSAQDLRPTSIILDCNDEKFVYLHRGTKTLAFRLPNVLELRDLLVETGPLVAPSANPEGLPPAKNISEAKNYFGDDIDLYVDGGTLTDKASRIIRLFKDGSSSIIRG